MRLKIFALSKYANYKSKFAERYCGLYLEKVQHVFSSDQDSRLTSEEVASHIGASRTTFRRYLKLLVSQIILDVDVNYGGIGRPERHYFMLLLR